MNKDRLSNQYDQQYLKALLHSSMSDLLNELDEEGKALLENNLSLEHFSARSCIFRQGETANKMYFILVGKLQVYVNDEAKEDKLRLIGHLSAGQLLGEVAYYRESKLREASVYALRDSYLAAIDLEIMDQLAHRYPAIHKRVVNSLIRKIDKINRGDIRGAEDAITSIIPFESNELTQLFITKLKEYCKDKNDCIILNSSNINSYPSVRDASEDIFSIRLESLLLELEASGKKVFLITEQEFNIWTKSCLRNCDKVVLLHEQKSDPKVMEFEREIMEYFEESHIRPHIDTVLLNTSRREIKNTRAWMKERSSFAFYHICPYLEQDIGRAYRLLANEQVGIVFSGGGMPGIAVAGVYQAIYEEGFIPDFVGGTSIGAYIGAGVANGWDPSVIAKKLRLAFSVNPMKDFTIPTLSLLKGNRLRKVLHKIYKRRIEDYAIPFLCIASDISTGEEVVLDRGDSCEVLMASSAIPGAFPPVKIGDNICVDGGILNNLPADVLIQRGVKKIIAVDFESQLHDNVYLPNKKNTLVSWFKQKKAKPNSKKLDIFTILIRSGLMNSEARIGRVKQLCDCYIYVRAIDRHFMDNSDPDGLIHDGYLQGKAYLAAHPKVKSRLLNS